MGLENIGFWVTVSDRNAKEMFGLYKLALAMKGEFATTVMHNSYYFHKMDNEIVDKDMVAGEFKKLITELFKTRRLKNWFRAYFNYGLINRIYGGKRLLPCEMGADVFFLDPFGDCLANTHFLFCSVKQPLLTFSGKVIFRNAARKGHH